MDKSEQKQLELLKTMQPGDVIEYGELFSKLDKEEPIVWKCIEKVQRPEDKKGFRVVVHLYYFEVMIRAVTATISEDSKINWSFG